MGFLDSVVSKMMTLPFVSKQIGILIRHGLSLIGGWLIAHGAAAEQVGSWVTSSEQMLTGLIAVFLAWVFSTVNKLKT